MNMMIKVLVPNFREEVQNYGPQYQRKGISISESKISKKASLSLAQHCVAEIGATNRLLAILGIVVTMMTMIWVIMMLMMNIKGGRGVEKVDIFTVIENHLLAKVCSGIMAELESF